MKQITKKKQALVNFLRDTGEVVDTDSVSTTSWGTLDTEHGEFLVLSGSELYPAASKSILDSLWAFNAKFLSEVSGLDASIFETLQSTNLCESLNDPFKALLKGKLNKLVGLAIEADGYGHFLSPYDGEHNRIEYDKGFWNIFRVN